MAIGQGIRNGVLGAGALAATVMPGFAEEAPKAPIIEPPVAEMVIPDAAADAQAVIANRAAVKTTEAQEVADATDVVYTIADRDSDLNTLRTLGIIDASQERTFQNAPLDRGAYAADRLVHFYKRAFNESGGNQSFAIDYVVRKRLPQALNHIGASA